MADCVLVNVVLLRRSEGGRGCVGDCFSSY